MKMTIYPPKEFVLEVKELVRKHNLYHEFNPTPLWTTVEFKLTGEVKNFNAFNRDYEKLVYPEEVKKNSLLRKMFSKILE